MRPSDIAPSHVFYRKYDAPLPKIVRGEGVYLYDDAGKRYLDGCGGAMVCNIGHGVAEVAASIGHQAASLAYVNGTAFTNQPVEELADMLVRKAPPGLDRAYFLSSGSEAVEAALKLARQYHVETGDTDRSIVIAQTPGYHGNTLLALAASAREHYRTMFGPWLADVVMIDAPYAYRNAVDAAAPAAALEAAILSVGAAKVAAFIAEPIGGSSTGASIPPAGYFAHVREICDRYGVLFVCDEVLTGAGRTGTYFGIEHFVTRSGGPIVPDIITMGKGINGGYAPLSAFITKSSIVETIVSGSGAFMHAQTYSHNPLAAAAGVAVQQYIDEHDLVKRAATMGVRLGEQLSTLRDSRIGDAGAVIGDIRGIGMLWSVEFVRDARTREPLPRAAKFAETLVAEAKNRGLVVWPNIGHAGNSAGDLVMVAPPFTIDEREIDELVTLLRASIVAAHERTREKAR